MWLYIPIDDAKLKIKVEPVFEIRERYERRTDKDFLSNVSDNRGDVFGRFRAGVNLKGKAFTGRFVYQYAHDWVWTLGSNSSNDRSDMVEANVSFSLDKTKVTLGRQRLAVGSQRLVGELNWHNVSNSFDAVSYEKDRFSAFVARQGVGVVPDKNLFLGGVTMRDSQGLTMAVVKTDELNNVQKGRLTMSREGKFKLGKGNVDYQVAGQIGHEDGKAVRAWAGFARYTMPVAKKIDGFFETNIASGGKSSDTVNTFDQLYPTGHDRFGLMDTTGWQNVRQLGAGLRFNVSPKETFKVQVMDLSLYDSGDSWYGVGGGANTRTGGTYTDATGASGRHLGRELDLDFSYKFDTTYTLTAGAGVFWPGTFPQNLQVGSSNRQLWGYVAVTKKF